MVAEVFHVFYCEECDCMGELETTKFQAESEAERHNDRNHGEPEDAREAFQSRFNEALEIFDD